jgi:hypothetical protein
MIDGVVNTGAHTCLEQNKILSIDLPIHVHSHLIHNYFEYLPLLGKTPNIVIETLNQELGMNSEAYLALRPSFVAHRSMITSYY